MHDQPAAPLSAPIDPGLEAPNSGARSVVVEFLGVSGSGKSTLARSLAARFEQQGCRTRLLSMRRPTLAKRLIGILAKSANLLKFALSNRHELGEVRLLLRLYPQQSMLHSVRVMQYILHLCAMRFHERDSYQITIFDQGFVQALYSLELFSKTDEHHKFIAAMSMIPKPDILVMLDVSSDTVDRRLRERRGLAKVARVAANDHETIHRSLNMITRIGDALSETRCCVVHYSPNHAVSIEQSTEDLFHALWPIVSEAATIPTAPHSRGHREYRAGAAVRLLWRRRLPL